MDNRHSKNFYILYIVDFGEDSIKRQILFLREMRRKQI